MDFNLRSTSRTRTTRLSMSIGTSENPNRSHSINFLGPSAVQPLSVQTVRAFNRANTAGVASLYNASFARKLGWSHIACAALCILLGSVTLILRCQVAWLGSPLWSGLAFFLVAGIFGIAAGPNDTCTVVSFMVMSVMSAIVSFVMLIAMLVAASTEYAFCRHLCDAAYCTTVCNGQAGRISVDVLVAVVGLMEFVVSIVSVSVSCRRTHATISAQTVVQHFFPSTGGQVTIYTSGQTSSLMGDQHQTHTHMPLHVYDHPSVYPVTLPGAMLNCGEEQSTSLPLHAAPSQSPLPTATNQDSNAPASSPGTGGVVCYPPSYPTGVVGDMHYQAGDTMYQDVVLPPYSQVSLDSTPEGANTNSTPQPPPPPFTSYITPDTLRTPEGNGAYPYEASMYPTLPPPYLASREFHNV